MIYLLHGPDEVSSRAFLIRLKENYSETLTLSVKKYDKLQEILPSSKSFFSSKQLIIIENFLPSEKIDLPEKVDLLIWSRETLTPPKWIDKNFFFKLTEAVSPFKLADSIALGQKKISLLILEKLLLENTPSEIIVGTLVRQFRLLVLGLEGNYQKVSASSFVQNKIKEQVKFWDLKKLRIASRALLKTDWEIKTGQIKKENSLTWLVVSLCNLAG